MTTYRLDGHVQDPNRGALEIHETFTSAQARLRRRETLEKQYGGKVQLVASEEETNG